MAGGQATERNATASGAPATNHGPARVAFRGAARRTLLVLAALALALGGTLAPVRATVVLAASDSLSLDTAATYTIVPARHVVRVVLDITARNEKPNVTAGGIVTRYFYEGARIAVQPEASAIKATSGGAKLTATTKPADGFRILEVRFRSAVFYHQTARLRITYDLPGGAPRSTSDIRVGTAFAAFVAWGFGDTASVRVVVPAGFDAEATGATTARSSSNGATIFRATDITDVGSWYLAISADRKSALTSDRIDLSGGEHVVIRGWPEDVLWRTRVRDLITKGLPELAEESGLDWPVAADLTVFEVHTPLLEGYAGVFHVGEDRIEISEDLDDLTILHEASHAWFNGGLFNGRWINEGLADTYAAKALEVVSTGGWAPRDVSPGDKAAVRLIDWTHPGRIADDATDAREHYGYDASWTVLRTLVREVGDEGMRKVFAAAQDHVIAYAGGTTPETVSAENDWRRFLDLLEEVGGSRTASEVFRRWVVTDVLTEQLDTRIAARTAYAGLVAAGADWPAPFFVRGPLSDWDFPLATSRIGAATAVIARRDALVARAAALGVTLPPDLRDAYIEARDSLAEANRVADAEEAAARALDTAISAVEAPRAPLVALGLLGTSPEADLAAARAAFSAGRPDAPAQATAVTGLIDSAVDIGRSRLLTAIVGLALLVVLLVAVAVAVIRRRRSRRRVLEPVPAVTGDAAATAPTTAPPTAVGEAAGGVGDETSYATLADQPPRPIEGDPTADAPPLAGSDAAGQPPPADRGDAS